MAGELTFEPRSTGGRPELTRDRARFGGFQGSGLGGGKFLSASGALGSKRRASDDSVRERLACDRGGE